MEPGEGADDRHIAAIGDRYCKALCAADGPSAEAIVAEALSAGLAPTTIQVRVITAAMRRIGELWEQAELTVADEHVATGLSYRALLPLQEPLQVAPPRSRERVALAAVEGQRHVLGLRMVADVLEGAGFEVLELGADVPTGALRAFVGEHMPAVIGLTSSLTRDAPELAAAIIAVHDADPECRIMLGGNGVPLPWRRQPFPWVPDAAAVVETVERLLHNPPQRLPPAIARLRSGGTRTQPSLPASASAEEAERLEPAGPDTSEVARRYARRAAEYRYLAYRDPLTALPNRRAFEDQVIALSGPGQDGALLAIDVDEFKEVNDTQGHEAGDALLHELGQVIHGAVRSTDTVARVGGDEFTVLLPACPPAEARRVAEQIRVAVEEMSGGKVTVSIGGARLGADRRGAALNADRALYAAKAAGRNRAELSAVVS